MTDWYQVLGVPRQATEEMIKKAYRRLAKTYHPDTHQGNQEYENKFRQISEAYSILSDTEKRKKYDEKLQASEFVEGKERRQESRRGEAPKAESVDFKNIYRNFEQFFGFNPDTKDIVNEDKLKPKTNNPLDASAIFEQFMGIKR